MMKLSVIVLIFAAIFGLIAADEFSCTPNEIIQYDCNTCTCAASGKSVHCNPATCSSKLPDTVALTPDNTDVVSQTNQVCTPNEIKMKVRENFNCGENLECKKNPHQFYLQDCNRCKCANNGIGWFCTRKACPPIDRPTRSIPVNAPGFTCTPNEAFKDDCNNCWCDASGRLARCTLMACPPRHKRAVQSPIAPKACEPGTKWFDGCNNCWCSENGHAACTMMFCFNSQESASQFGSKSKRSVPIKDACTPGTSWKQECNTCWCSETGIAACTLKGCITNNFSGHHGQHLRPAQKQVSMDEYHNENFECTPNESFKLDCNTCKCGIDGHSTSWCTKKQCIPRTVGDHVQKSNDLG